MFIDQRRRVAGLSAVKDTAYLPWLASSPSASSELVCVGKIKSNGVSQSLFIDRSEWPPKASQHSDAEQVRPRQARAAAVVAASAVAAAASPKVICISPISSSVQRSQTVIRRAVTTSANRRHYHQQQQQQPQQKEKEVMMIHARQKTCGSKVGVIEVVSMFGPDAAASTRRQTVKRTLDQTKNEEMERLRDQKRTPIDAKTKSAMLTDADTSTKSTVFPGSSILLPGWTSKGCADGRQQLRPILPRSVDAPLAYDRTGVVTIVPSGFRKLTLCQTSAAYPDIKPPSSSVVACTQSTSSPTACSSSVVECREHFCSTNEPVDVECRSTKDRNETGVISSSQLLQRIRLIECEMATSSAASQVPMCISIVPASQSDVVPPSERDRVPGSTPDAGRDDDDDDDGQPPAKMLEALRLVRSTRPRPDDHTGATSADATSTTDGPASAVQASRLVTLKLVNRPVQ